MALPAKFRSATLFLLMIAGLALSAQTASSAECWGETNIILGDFNDDGRQDLVIGSPFSLVALAGEAGVVHVLYGTASGPGFSVLPQQLWYLDLPGIPGDSESSDNFGRSLAVGDFDCDGIDDLVIGEKEAVTVLYGSIPGGLTTTGVQRLTGTIGSGFGRAVAAGNFGDQQGCGDDLAVGAPYSSGNGGHVHIYYGAPVTGVVPASETLLDQNSPGVPGVLEPHDFFGATLVVGNFDNDAYDDLAVGVPGEEVTNPIGQGTSVREGAVNVLYGGAVGFELSRSQIWHQDVESVKGHPEALDQFGLSLAVGDFEADGYDDLIVGVPGEGDERTPYYVWDNITSSGAVNVIYGSPTGLKATSGKPGEIWSQGSEGIKGQTEDYDTFGLGVAGGDFDGDGYDDMAVGTPREDREGLVEDGGVMQVIFGGSGGLHSSGDQLVHQDTSGEWVEGAIQVYGGLHDNDFFGCVSEAGRLDDDAYDDLVVTVRDGSDVSLNVIFGSASGLTAEGNHQWICEGLAGCSAFRQLLNLPSFHSPVTDGIYTDPPGTGEWSDVLPLAFSIGADGPVATDPADSSAVDSTFFAALGPEPDPEVAHLNLHFDFVLRTDTDVFSFHGDWNYVIKPRRK